LEFNPVIKQHLYNKYSLCRIKPSVEKDFDQTLGNRVD